MNMLRLALVSVLAVALGWPGLTMGDEVQRAAGERRVEVPL